MRAGRFDDRSYVDYQNIREEIFEVHLAPLKKWKD
jgi:hypothetical protein